MPKLLRAIYTMHSLNGLAGSFIGIFVPIYLLTLDYSLTDIFVYHMTWAVCVGFSFLISSTVSRFIGIRKTILAGFPFLFGYLACLYQLPGGHIPLTFLAVLAGLQIAFYWYPIQVLFGEAANAENVGSEVSRLFAFPQLLSVLGPVLGGVITATFGFGSLIVFVAIVYLVSLIPLLAMGDSKRPPAMHGAKLFAIFKGNKKYVLLQIFDVFLAEPEGVFWPIFLFLTFHNILSIGLVGTFLGIGSAILTLIVGKYSDSRGGLAFLRAGALAMALVWILRSTVESELLLYGISVGAGFFSALVTVPFNARVYRLAKVSGVAEFIVFRELVLMLSRVLLYGLATLIAIFVPAQLFHALFLSAAFSSILLLSF